MDDLIPTEIDSDVQALQPVDVDDDPPSLTPQQIAQFSANFRAESVPYYATWRECTDVMTNWRSRNGSTAVPAGQSSAVQFGRARHVNVNLTEPKFREAASRLSTETPSVGVLPVSEDTDDLNKARAAEQMIRYHWREAKVKAQLDIATEWAIMHGTSGILTYMGGKRGEDVRQEAFRPEFLRAEPGVSNPEESRFLGVIRITTKAELKRQFPEKAREIDGAPRPSAYTYTTGGMRTMLLPEDRVEILEAYCRSGHSYLLIGSEGTVLASGKTPGACMPIQVIRYTRVPGQFWGMGMVEMFVPIQYTFTSVVNAILDNARLMGSPKWLIHRQSKVDEDALTSNRGEKALYDGIAPIMTQPSALPQYFESLPDRVQAWGNVVTGMSATAAGHRVVGVTSGRGVDALTENSLAQLSTTQTSIEDAAQGLSYCYLLFAKDFYPENKVVREFGPTGGKAIFTTLQAANIADDPEVFLEPGTLFSADVKARDARTLDMLRLGMLTPEQAREKLSFHLDPMAPVKIIADTVHWQKMLYGVIELGHRIDPVTGQPTSRAQIFPTDNLKVGAEVVGSFMQQDEFYDLPPDRQDAVVQFYQQIVALAAPPALPVPGAPKGMSLPAAPAAAPPGQGASGGPDQGPEAAVDHAEAAAGG